MSSSAPGGEARLALMAGISCYLIWGFVPLVFQATAALFVLLAKQGRQVMRVLRHPRTLAWLFLSAVLIAINWVVFIWAVTSGRPLETRLGYYINPLVSMGA